MSSNDSLEALEKAATPGKWEAGTFSEYGADYLATVPEHIDGDRKMISTTMSLDDAKFVSALVNDYRVKNNLNVC